jgi:hypothetical protein
MQSRLQRFKDTNTPQVRGAPRANKFGDPRTARSVRATPEVVTGSVKGHRKSGKAVLSGADLVSLRF